MTAQEKEVGMDPTARQLIFSGKHWNQIVRVLQAKEKLMNSSTIN